MQFLQSPTAVSTPLCLYNRMENHIFLPQTPSPWALFTLITVHDDVFGWWIMLQSRRIWGETWLISFHSQLRVLSA